MRRALLSAIGCALVLPSGAAAAYRPLVAEVRGLEVRSVDTATHAEVIRSARSVRVALPGDVLFAFDDARLSRSGRRAVTKAGTLLGRHNLTVEGYTDARGAAAYNLRLAQRRAATVAAALRARMPGVRVTVRAFGEARPVASNATARGRARNRRVEIRAVR
jgi:outer membrane protein OmpA-like peptidoglycan-associated protein